MTLRYMKQRLLNWISLYCCLVLSYPFGARATDDWNVDGEHGELHVFGVLSEGAGELDMKSSHQDVAVDTNFRVNLRAPGDMGPPISFTLHFRDIKRTYGSQTDHYTGAITYSAVQPVITVSFDAPVDYDNPSLIRVRGTSGVALLLRDQLGRKVIPGEEGEPLFLTPSSDDLVYTVTPVRTSAPLTTGTFKAVARFRVEYD
ncbi:fimbrial protein [Enterobacter mori]|uniref:fimbrial protein n=2 Tax=Enterobacter TaxID=547 RepID=UPI0007BE92C8|nr:fimbrial protein [Enterobacter mori]KZQ36084.1 hypothetical protein A3464_06755 [Enterobacter genomosp. O]MBS0865789.1 type 1 fimbrial protein [Enterobacter mori]